MGAAGVRATVADLLRQGHTPLILERGSDDFKLWKSTRIKGWRVPDLLCVNDATRVEVRSKSKFVIAGSHSTTKPERDWAYGLADDDYMAFPVCYLSGERPVDWEAASLIQYIRVGDMREAVTQKKAKMEKAKDASRGSETQITWPSVTAKELGKVTKLTDTSIQYTRASDERKITLQLGRTINGEQITLQPQSVVGQPVLEHQVIAAVVPVRQDVPVGPAVGGDHYLQELKSVNQRIRFAAVKALSGFPSPAADTGLLDRMNDVDEHIFIRLEAAASLARHGSEPAWTFFTEILACDNDSHRLEACIVLAEIDTDRSRNLLTHKLAEADEHIDVRSAAAWSLGEHRHPSVFDALATAYGGSPAAIRIEAARALSKVAEDHADAAIELFGRVNDASRPGVAFALRFGTSVGAAELANVLTGEDARQWAAYVIGTGRGPEAIEVLRDLDSEVYFAATLLWKMLTTGIYNLKEYG